MKYLELIEQAKKDGHYWKAEIIQAFQMYLYVDHLCRMNPCAWSSVHGDPKDPVWGEYYLLQEESEKRYAKLWMLTDVEYAEDGFRNYMWTWRYMKVMARKCTWYLEDPSTQYKAVEIMGELERATEEFARVCGLENEYKSPSYYIEKQFPNLKTD